MRNTKAIFFDMGNTLINFHKGDSDEVKDLKGVSYLTDYLKTFNKDISEERVNKDFLQKWSDGIISRKDKFIEYPIEEFLNGFLMNYGVKLTICQCVEAINRFYTEYRTQMVFDNKLRDILKEVKLEGYKIGIISNTCYYDEVMIECFKYAELFDFIEEFTFSYSIRIGKPQKEIFLKALSKMNVTAEHSVMVGDNLISDIKPANELGMKSIWINPKGIKNNTDIKPLYEISRLEEIFKYI